MDGPEAVPTPSPPALTKRARRVAPKNGRIPQCIYMPVDWHSKVVAFVKHVKLDGTKTPDNMSLLVRLAVDQFMQTFPDGLPTASAATPEPLPALPPSPPPVEPAP